MTGGTGQVGEVYGVGGSVFGGGAEINGTGSQLLNDTIYGNQITSGSGSTSGSAYGAGVNDASGGLTFVNVTVAANVAALVAPAAGGTAGTPFGGGINNYLGLDPASIFTTRLMPRTPQAPVLTLMALPRSPIPISSVMGTTPSVSARRPTTTRWAAAPCH